jgi:hypothetical protein
MRPKGTWSLSDSGSPCKTDRIESDAHQGEVGQVSRSEQMAVNVVGVEQNGHREIGLIAPASAQREAAGRCVVHRCRSSAAVEAAKVDRPVRLKLKDLL